MLSNNLYLCLFFLFGVDGCKDNGKLEKLNVDFIKKLPLHCKKETHHA